MILGNWPQLLDLDGERNFGAWWGASKLSLAGVLVLAVPILAPERRIASALFYWTVGLGFLWLSADEALAIHERVTALNLEHDLGMPMLGDRQGAWIPLYATFAVLLAAVFLPSILRLLKGDITSCALVGGGMAVTIAGGVGVESLGYYAVLDPSGWVQVLVEELLELVRVSLVVTGAAHHLVAATRRDTVVESAAAMSGRPVGR